MMLTGRTALVTGSSRNIGRAMVLAFAHAGANVIVNARTSQSEVDAVVEEARSLGVESQGILADISDPEQVQAMADEVLGTFGQVGILVNNAAIRPGKPFVDIDFDEWRRVMSVDLDGAFHCIKAFLPGMLHNRWGRIINVAGMSAFRGNVGYTHVSASKMGLVGLTRSLAVELAPHNILANCIVPGIIDTSRPNTENVSQAERERLQTQRIKGIPLGRLGEPNEIAEVCLFLASPGGGYISGQTVHVNGAADRR